MGNGMVVAENGYDVKVRAPGTHDAAEKFPQVKKTGGVSSWQPVLAVTLRPTENSRRYARTTRFPSIFESTIGFSAKANSVYPLKPERATNIEFGYTYDFSGPYIRPTSATLSKNKKADMR